MTEYLGPDDIQRLCSAFSRGHMTSLVDTVDGDPTLVWSRPTAQDDLLVQARAALLQFVVDLLGNKSYNKLYNILKCQRVVNSFQAFDSCGLVFYRLPQISC